MKIQQITETAVSKTNRSRNEIGYKNWNEIQRAVRHSSSNPSDPRHSARLTIDGREVVISKQSAEQLFRWIKKNFKTKHERELYDFLAHQRLLGVLDDEKSLNEINYASALADPTISKKEIIANSIEDGTIGSRKVFLYSSGDNKIYYFERDSHIDALVYIFKDRLLGMKNYSDNRGLIFNLLQFVINIKNKTLRLTASDKLTSEGLQWIIRQIKSKNGFNITDAQGNAIDPHELYAEWEQARTTGVHGPTEIIISKSSNSVSIKENEERLIPMDIWGATLLHTASNVLDMSELFEAVVHIENSNETLLELAPYNRDGDNRPERPLSLEDVAKIIKARLGSDWTMERSRGQPRQPGYKFIPADKTKHAMGKIWCVHDIRRGEYPTYNTILFSSSTPAWHAERAQLKTVANALATAQLIFNNPGGVKDATAESVTHSDKVPKLCGLSFNAIHKLVESNNANNYSKFHNVISSQYSINDTLELYGIYLRQLDVHISGQTLLEGACSNIERKLFKQFEERCAGSINNAHVGDSVSLLHLATLNVPGHKVVAKLNGFLSPKEIVKIVNNDSHVELEFADGSRYPDGDDVFQKIQTWNMTKLFSTSEDASKAYTTYALIGKQLSDKLDFTTSVNTDITEAKRKRKSRSRSTARTVYGGWWGGLGNDSGEDVTEGLEHSSQDLKDVAQWMHTTPDKLKIIVKQEPIEKFIKQIREMYGTYDEFPEDRERTESILELLKNGAQPMPVYVEEGDRDYFVMEGRHRMVAFWLAGMKTIPVAYVSVKEQDVTEGMGDYSDEEIQRYGTELIQRQRNLDLLASVFGQDQIHRVARALRAGNLKRNLSSAEGNAEYRSRYRRAVRILDSMTDESGNIMPHTDTTLYRRK